MVVRPLAAVVSDSLDCDGERPACPWTQPQDRLAQTFQARASGWLAVHSAYSRIRFLQPEPVRCQAPAPALSQDLRTAPG